MFRSSSAPSREIKAGINTYAGVLVNEETLSYRAMQIVPTWDGTMFERLMVSLLVPEAEWAPQEVGGTNHPLYVRAQIEYGLNDADLRAAGDCPPPALPMVATASLASPLSASGRIPINPFCPSRRSSPLMPLSWRNACRSPLIEAVAGLRALADSSTPRCTGPQASGTRSTWSTDMFPTGCWSWTRG